MTTGNTPRRGRGRPPRIDQEQIVAAARAIEPGALTMQAVADALGVDRTTLHYYVGDRDGLLELVVADLFETELRSIELPEHAGWQAVLRAYGSAIRQGVLKLGVTATSFRLRGTSGAASLALAEQVLRVLTDSGFSADDAGRVLTLVSGLAMSAAHDVLGSAESRLHHQTPEVVRALKDLPPNEFPLLSGVVADRDAAATAAQDFEFNLDIVIAGLEGFLAG
ncbi:TetR/AcrR family transcriptional regulator [Mycolicibacterium setense]|uniref:TetR family transcriptional regulator n=1 Tax=Mycolicibacterium setense TaxID=431269 RepID=A0ABR4Z169_9MYCO|nr:TetR/AcrR family transcriptional regulator C-terminal domain-containing protein [Mycolicibacterium setense]KHO24741.1 TetR family transcriptional regulator [Mycolicibacterium setense]KHO28236.1 TetR family transcriptional regulator [Mycolicibacterium setense]MCV7110040.1 TetR/AcrR family transcriptional regulator [Mycolicibacterium setense]